MANEIKQTTVAYLASVVPHVVMVIVDLPFDLFSPVLFLIVGIFCRTRSLGAGSLFKILRRIRLGGFVHVISIAGRLWRMVMHTVVLIHTVLGPVFFVFCVAAFCLRWAIGRSQFGLRSVGA